MSDAPTDDQVHRYVQKLLQRHRDRCESMDKINTLHAIINDLWRLRERDRVEFERRLGAALDDQAAKEVRDKAAGTGLKL